MSSADVDIWLPLYIGDTLAEVQDMSAAEVGGYMLLIMYAWKHGGHIPNDTSALKKISRLSEQKLNNVANHFKHDRGRLYHPRLRDLYLQAVENKKQKQTQTQAATRARWPHKASVTDSVTHNETDSVTVSPSPASSPLSSTSPPPEKASAEEGGVGEGRDAGVRVELEEWSRIINRVPPGSPDFF